MSPLLLIVAQLTAALGSAECAAPASGVPPVHHSLMQTARKGPQLISGRGAVSSGEPTAPEVGLSNGLPDWWQNITSPSEIDSVVRSAIRDGQAPMIQKLAGVIAGTIQWAQKQMMESAREDKAKGDEILDAALAQMTTCASALNEVAVLAANESYQAGGAAHKQCRQAESELFVLDQGLIAELSITVSAEDDACAGLDELSHAEAAQVVQPGESPDDVEKTRQAHVLKEEMSLQKARCEDAQRAMSDRQEALSVAQSELSRRTSECDIAQDKLELAACTLASEVQGQCLNYTECYDASRDTYSVLRATHKEWVDGRKAEWTLSRQLECVVELLGKGVVSFSRNDEDWLFEGCKASHQDDFPLEFGRTTREALKAEPCGIVGDLYPCTEAFVAKEYSGLPKDAPGKVCTPCAAVFSSEKASNDTSQQQLPSTISSGTTEVTPVSMPSDRSTVNGDTEPTETKALDIAAGSGSPSNTTALDRQPDSAASDGTSQRNSIQPASIHPAADGDAVIPANYTESNSTGMAVVDAFDAGDDLQAGDANGLMQASAWADGLFDVEED